MKHKFRYQNISIWIDYFRTEIDNLNSRIRSLESDLADAKNKYG